MSISAQSITLQWDNGSVIFSQLNFHLSAGFHALVGRNGSGKSSLLHALSGEHMQGGQLLRGDIQRIGATVLVAQSEPVYGQSVAQFLGIEAKLTALKRIHTGSVEVTDFELVGDDWLFKQTIEADIAALGFTNAAGILMRPMHSLSGGQQMRLRLYRAFQHNPLNLLLDEPSNHLDAEGQLWLRAQCNAFVKQPNRVLLIASHDRALLDAASWVHELSTLGLQTYQGNYADYRQQSQLQREAAIRQLQDARKHKKQLQQQIQRSRVIAQQRDAQGRRQRQRGGQAKILLDFAKNNAQKTSQALNTKIERQQAEAESALNQAASRVEFIDTVSLPQPAWTTTGNRQVLHCNDVQLPFGVQSRINFSLKAANKLRIQGSNGVGKSVLLKVIEGRMPPKQGQLHGNYDTHVLDQHFSLISEHQNGLDNLLNYTQNLTLTEARTHLAQVGLGADKVMLEAASLSGGEQMKLALLMVMLAGVESTKPQLLILDEPDNHLDLEAKQQLASALRQYHGAILLVTHDDAFAMDVGVTDTLDLEHT
ncbi:MAG: hypothetical protein C0463_08525 [Idiomarina sp.]|nr:hypothetical protein [Idiomarina sp.]